MKEDFQWGSGNGGGALEVVIDSQGKTFGWLCEDRRDNKEYFVWWIDRGQSGSDFDYTNARTALGKAASEYVKKKEIK